MHVPRAALPGVRHNQRVATVIGRIPDPGPRIPALFRPPAGGEPGADYFAAGGKITRTASGLRPCRSHGDPDSRIHRDGPVCALSCAGARQPLPCGREDRDRDESSRRGISAWVRTNPQTHVGMRERRTRAPILFSRMVFDYGDAERYRRDLMPLRDALRRAPPRTDRSDAPSRQHR